MISAPTAGLRSARLRLPLIALLLGLAALAGCPGEKAGSKSPPIEAAAGEYPRAALDYLELALQSPTEGYPALGHTWTVIAQLDQLPEARGGAAIRASIGAYVTKAGRNPPPELIAAWLNCSREQAIAFIKAEGGQGNWRYLGALWYAPAVARQLLANPATRIVPESGVSSDLAARWLEMQQMWADVQPVDKDLLNIISDRPNDPANTLRATGWLLRLEPEGEFSQAWLDYLELGIKSAEPGQMGKLMGATEGVKISRHPELAEILVPIAASVQLTGKPPTLGQQESDEANPQQLLVSYALSQLPGDQARLMRTKLLAARDVRIRWQARLGELLYGNPQPWDEALEKEGLGKGEFWIALDRVDSPEPALLPTYRLMAESDDATLRVRALSRLNRFRPFAANPDVVELVTKLSKDEVPEVRAAAWYAAGRIGIGEPLTVLQDKQETPEVRLAAAYAALMHAQGGPPDMRDNNWWSITGETSSGEQQARPDSEEIDSAGQEPASAQDGGESPPPLIEGGGE